MSQTTPLAELIERTMKRHGLRDQSEFTRWLNEPQSAFNQVDTQSVSGWTRGANYPQRKRIEARIAALARSKHRSRAFWIAALALPPLDRPQSFPAKSLPLAKAGAGTAATLEPALVKTGGERETGKVTA